MEMLLQSSDEQQRPRTLLRSVISSDLTALDRLHVRFKWIPNSQRIRPSEERLTLKRAKLAEIEATWLTFTDYIRSTVFGEPHIDVVNQNGEQRKTTTTEMTAQSSSSLHKFFVPNEFPYNLVQGNHWVLWYTVVGKPYSDREISADISQHLQELLHGSVHFDFAWYVNPKMTVPEYFHVQVFWIDTTPTTPATTTPTTPS